MIYPLTLTHTSYILVYKVQWYNLCVNVQSDVLTSVMQATSSHIHVTTHINTNSGEQKNGGLSPLASILDGGI